MGVLDPIDVDVVSRALLVASPLDYGIDLRRLDGSAAVRLGEGIPAGLSPDAKHVLGDRPGRPDRARRASDRPGPDAKAAARAIVHHGWAAWMPDGRRVVVSGAEPERRTRLYLQDVKMEGNRGPSREREFVLPPMSPARCRPTDSGSRQRPGPEDARYPMEGGRPRPDPGARGRP